MKSLPNVTLIAFDGEKIEETIKVVDYCASLFYFGSIRVLTDREVKEPFKYDYLNIDIMKSYYKADYNGYMIWEIERMVDYIETSHALFVSRDGMIINPQRWDDSWLQYDYIGAPWPKFWKDYNYQGQILNISKNRVGNGGFYLISKRFLKACQDSSHLYKIGQPSDVWRCQIMYEAFKNIGLKYAPVDVAAAFSWEHPIEEGGADWKSFGWHGYVSGKTKEHFDTMMKMNLINKTNL